MTTLPLNIQDSDVKIVGHLPSYYTDVQPVVTPNKNPPIPGGAESFLQKGITETDLGQENMWLQVVRDACDSDDAPVIRKLFLGCLPCT